MIIKIISLTSVLISLGVLIYTWITNVDPLKKNNEDFEVQFYDDYDDEDKKTSPWYSSNVDNLDSNVSGAVRYNQSMYYDSNEFEELKTEVLSYEFPR